MVGPGRHVPHDRPRRAVNAGIQTKISCHTFRATGITEYLRNGGKLEVAQQMANHESAQTTSLYLGRGVRPSASVSHHPAPPAYYRSFSACHLARASFANPVGGRHLFCVKLFSAISCTP